MNDSLLCLIPARSGSKGVPNKNIRCFLGEPLIAHTIRAACQAKLHLSGETDLTIYLSSDSNAYLEIADRMGVGTIKRPNKLAADTTPMVDVVRHALALSEAETGKRYTSVLLLQPTCPARQPWHILEAYQLYKNRRPSSLVSVVRVEDSHPARMYMKDTEGFGKSLVPKDSYRNRQQLSALYHRNGAIYLSETALLAGGKLVDDAPLLYEMDKKYSINIDDEVDWIFAEALCASLRKT